MAEILFVGVIVHGVSCETRSMRLKQELLRLPDSDPQLCTTLQALKDNAWTKEKQMEHRKLPPPHVGASTEGGPDRPNTPTKGILKLA
jgi:hypothetical protein